MLAVACIGAIIVRDLQIIARAFNQVELLKDPLCVGPARRVILDQLEHRYQRKFADQWAFVRFAQEQQLGLDFTSPPKEFASPTAQ